MSKQQFMRQTFLFQKSNGCHCDRPRSNCLFCLVAQVVVPYCCRFSVGLANSSRTAACCEIAVVSKGRSPSFSICVPARDAPGSSDPVPIAGDRGGVPGSSDPVSTAASRGDGSHCDCGLFSPARYPPILMRIGPRCTHRRVPGSIMVGAGDADGVGGSLFS